MLSTPFFVAMFCSFATLILAATALISQSSVSFSVALVARSFATSFVQSVAFARSALIVFSFFALMSPATIRSCFTGSTQRMITSTLSLGPRPAIAA